MPLRADGSGDSTAASAAVGTIAAEATTADVPVVVGPAMDGHLFTEGDGVALNGRSTPWNTFAIWNVDVLSLTGFPLVAEGIGGDRTTGGVEEVSAISLLQHINPRYQALLIKMLNIDPSISLEWLTKHDDTERQEYHDFKMRSKIERPALHMLRMGICSGTVNHITDRSDTK